MSDSYVTIRPGSMSYVGQDATRLLHAKTVYHALKACKVGMRLTRTATPTRTFESAGKITGKTYKRGQYDQAMTDVRQWIVAMEAALPIVRE